MRVCAEAAITGMRALSRDRRPSTWCFTTMTAISMTAAVTPPKKNPTIPRLRRSAIVPSPCPHPFCRRCINFRSKFPVNFRLTCWFQLPACRQPRSAGLGFSRGLIECGGSSFHGRPHMSRRFRCVDGSRPGRGGVGPSRASLRGRRHPCHAGWRFPGTAHHAAQPARNPAPAPAHHRAPRFHTSSRARVPPARRWFGPARDSTLPARICDNHAAASVRAAGAAPSRHLSLGLVLPDHDRGGFRLYRYALRSVRSDPGLRAGADLR